MALRTPWGNCGLGTSRSPAGVAVVPLAGASRCAAARAADVFPFAHGASAGQNAAGVEVLKGPQRPLVWALERE
jgi:hypothetical protein